MDVGIIISEICPLIEKGKNVFLNSEMRERITALESGVFELYENEEINTNKLFGLISFYLGAKKTNIKINEIEYLIEKGVEKFIIFPDLKNIRFNDIDLFEKEINEIEKFIDIENLFLYLPLEKFSKSELSDVFNVLKNKKIRNIVIGSTTGKNYFSWEENLRVLKENRCNFKINCFLRDEEYKNKNICNELEKNGISNCFFHLN